MDCRIGQRESNRTKEAMILIVKLIENTYYRLCQDGKWRSFANFGTYPECVKEYKSLGFAKKRAKKVKGQVAVIREGLEVDASGNVFVAPTIHSLATFIV
jgi:hypothetical protein